MQDANRLIYRCMYITLQENARCGQLHFDRICKISDRICLLGLGCGGLILLLKKMVSRVMTKKKVNDISEERLQLLDTISDLVGLEVDRRMELLSHETDSSPRRCSLWRRLFCSRK